jgi:adenylate cyclase
MTKRFSAPFSATLLGLMGLIVVPLAGALFWLGSSAVNSMEERIVRQRLQSLNTAVGTFLDNGLQVIVAAGATLAEGPSFHPAADAAAQGTRAHQLLALLQRQPLVAAAYVGYADGRFLYAGRTNSLSGEQRLDYGAPEGESFIVRRIEGSGPGRTETWWFENAAGRSAERSRPTEYDPRRRPWYVEALGTNKPAITEPYVFANADVVGVSAAVPLPGKAGAFGFDVTLDTLTALVSDLRITPNSIIMVGNAGGGVFVQSRGCTAPAGCLPGGGQARLALATAVAESGGRQPLHRHVGSGETLYELFVEPIPPMLGRSFVVAAAVPDRELSAESHALMRNSALAAAAAIGLAVLAALAGSLMLSRPLYDIAAKTERIRNLDFSDHSAVRSRIREVLLLSESVDRMRDGLEVFGRYVSRGLVQRIMESPRAAGLRGERRDITVMFTDVESFSRISERLEPEVLTRRLSHYFEVLGRAIAGNHGTIDKYIGDGIMAYWNAPDPDPDHLVHACRAALQVRATSRRLADKWRKRGWPAFRTRIGVHTGPAIVGNVGARQRINYTLVGTVANQASRLEGLNKAYDTELLVSGEIVARAGDAFVWRHVDRAVAAGTTELHDLYEPLGEAAEATALAPFLEHWREARRAYDRGDFGPALQAFRAAVALRPDDGPSHVFIARCEAFLHKGPPDAWDGAWRFDRK